MVSLGNTGSGTAALATTTSSKAAEKKKKKSKSTGKHRANKFKDDATVDSFLYDKVSFHRKGQSVQIINNSSDSIIHPCWKRKVPKLGGKHLKQHEKDQSQLRASYNISRTQNISI